MSLMLTESVDVVEDVSRLEPVPITCNPLKGLPWFEVVHAGQSGAHLFDLRFFLANEGQELVKLLCNSRFWVTKGVLFIVDPTRGEHDWHWRLTLMIDIRLAIITAECDF